ncbi:hypothetical protein SAMN05518865_13024 [Duganella sp. CF458]|uniref:hypothetical protein n=1 Tax=Duganella sp. CF458 TaxID=1884368 RepID=UPI0008DFD698|nr:hypothetical protein [Duganella sp. CF458]SFH01620.1 hypothetical protein SAMN05518865_13024 [Duganella sp. CF458]
MLNIETSFEAYNDVLIIVGDAPKSALPVSTTELHLFAYLACVLSLFQGNPIGDWGYSFGLSQDGFPFSADLEFSKQTLINNGFIDANDFGSLTPIYPEIRAEIDFLQGMSMTSTRRKWLQAATQCSLALPLGSIRYAMSKTPGIRSAQMLKQRRQLLDSHEIAFYYEEYKIVESVLGEVSEDLLSPAVLWLSAKVMRSGGT